MKHASLKGLIRFAGDKSVSHRAIMFAALARGKSRLENLSKGADVATTSSFLQDLGVKIVPVNGGVLVESPGFRGLHTTKDLLFCGNSGTTLRLGMGILAGSGVSCKMSGDESLNKRPVKRVIEPLALMGGKLSTEGSADKPPVIVQGAPLHGISYVSKVASAQVKSAVLLAAINAEGATIYSEPSKSRDHTERFLIYQGCPISVSERQVTMEPPFAINPFDYEVPGDFSTAAFFIVAATLLQGSELTIEKVVLNDTRTGALDMLKRMGANLAVQSQREYRGEPIGEITVRSSTLRGIDTKGIEMARYIDEVPILAVAAMFANGTTTFYDIGELRVKESDRAEGIVEMLACYGCQAAIAKGSLSIEGGCEGKISEPDHRNDHRLAMAIEVIDLVLQGSVSGKFAGVISISAPEFYSILQSCLV